MQPYSLPKSSAPGVQETGNNGRLVFVEPQQPIPCNNHRSAWLVVECPVKTPLETPLHSLRCLVGQVVDDFEGLPAMWRASQKARPSHRYESLRPSIENEFCSSHRACRLSHARRSPGRIQRFSVSPPREKVHADGYSTGTLGQCRRRKRSSKWAIG